MWKNTQLGPLFICFKRRESYKSLGRASGLKKQLMCELPQWQATFTPSPVANSAAAQQQTPGYLTGS